MFFDVAIDRKSQNLRDSAAVQALLQGWNTTSALQNAGEAL